jgi:uncharacterized C2H2 Zn-finger protein
LKCKHAVYIVYSCFHCEQTFQQLKYYQLHLENTHNFDCDKNNTTEDSQQKTTMYFCNVVIEQ